MSRLTHDLGRLLSTALGLESEAFEKYLKLHVSSLDSNWYPPQLGEILPGKSETITHIDFSLFTILSTDSEPGLQVRDHDGTWHSLTAPTGTYIVNIGDAMNRITNDRWRATYHRVVNPAEDRRSHGRMSIPFFVMPG